MAKQVTQTMDPQLAALLDRALQTYNAQVAGENPQTAQAAAAVPSPAPMAQADLGIPAPPPPPPPGIQAPEVIRPPSDIADAASMDPRQAAELARRDQQDPETFQMGLKNRLKEYSGNSSLEPWHRGLQGIGDVLDNIGAREQRRNASRWQGTPYAQYFDKDLQQTKRVGSSYEDFKTGRDANDPNSPATMQAALAYSRATGVPVRELLSSRMTQADLGRMQPYLNPLVQRAMSGEQQATVRAQAEAKTARQRQVDASKEAVARGLGPEAAALPQGAPAEASAEVIGLAKSRMQADATSGRQDKQLAFAEKIRRLDRDAQDARDRAARAQQFALEGMKIGAKDQAARDARAWDAEKHAADLDSRAAIANANANRSDEKAQDSAVASVIGGLKQGNLIELSTVTQDLKREAEKLPPGTWENPLFRGYLTNYGEKGKLGRAVTEFGGLAVPKEWKNFAQSFANLQGIIVHDRKGAAVTEIEMPTVRAEMGKGWSMNQQSVNVITDGINNFVQNRTGVLAAALNDAARAKLERQLQREGVSFGISAQDREANVTRAQDQAPRPQEPRARPVAQSPGRAAPVPQAPQAPAAPGTPRKSGIDLANELLSK